MKDYYEILEVHPKASNEIIKKAYITLAKKFHPDTTAYDKSYAQKRMTDINEAYTILSDLRKRREYDESYFHKESTEIHGQNGNNADVNRNSQDNSLDGLPAAQYIYKFGQEILNELNTKIIREAGNEIKNREICDRLDAKIQGDLFLALGVVESSIGNKARVYYFIGIICWHMASAYTWTNDRQSPKRYIALADKYISRDVDYYGAYQKTRRTVLSNDEVFMGKEEIPNESRLSRTSASCLARIILVAIIMAASYFYGGDGKSNSNNKKSHPVGQTQQKTVARPIAKEGVVTGYDMNQPIRNNNGLSTLTIDNTNNEMPVYVRIWSIESGKPVRAFYIRQGEKFTARDITAGTYQVRYKELYANNVRAKASKSEQFELKEYTIGRTTHYSNMSLTLYKVKNGNTRTTDIDENDV